MDAYRLLHVDADRERRCAVGDRLEADRQFVAEPEFTGSTAIDTLGHESYDAVLVGHPLPGQTAAFVRQVRGGYPDMPILAYGDDASFDARTTRALFRAGVTDHLPMGGDSDVDALLDRLDEAIEAFLERQRTHRGAEAFSRLGDAIADAPTDLDGSVDAVLAGLRDTYDVDYAGLARIVGDEYHIVAVDATPDLASSLEETVPLEETYCETTVREGRTVASAPEGGIREGIRPAVARRLGLECYLGTPVYVDGTTFGTLCVADRSRRQGFARWERTGIELAARWIARELEHDREKQTLRSSDGA